MMTKRVIALAAGVAAWACNGNSTQPAGPPLDLLKSGGDAQSWYFNNPLPTPLSVTAIDVSGRPVPGVVVTWTVTSGGVNPAQSTTNASGVATTTDSLGFSTTQTVSASFTGLQSAVTFTEIGSAPPTTAAVSLSGSRFNPSSVVVQVNTGTAGVGDVTWTWNDSPITHNVTFPGDANPPQQATGTYTRTFTAVGTYSYSCTLHLPNMTGTVRVVH